MTRCLPWIIVILNFTTVTIIAVLIARLKGQTENVKPGEGLCIKCEDFNLTYQPGLMDKLTRYQEGGADFCCAYNSEQMSALLNLVPEQRQEAPPEYLDRKNVSLGTVSAHKVLGYRKFYMGPKSDRLPDFNPGPEGDLVFINKDKFKPLEHVHGVEALQNGFRILRSGLYNVYSGLHFAPINFKKCGEFPDPTFYHRVVRIKARNPEKRIVILEASYTCPDEADINSHTTYTAGQFELETGDVIQAECSMYGVLLFTGDSNFLGLFLIY